MKMYKKFKKLKPDVKVGLITMALYATTLAMPVYAAVEQELSPQKVVEHIVLDNVTTTDQIESLNKEKLAEYSADNLLELIELENIYKIQEKRVEMMKAENELLSVKYAEEYSSKLDDLEDNMAIVSSALANTRENSVFVDVRERLNNDILKYYPALINPEEGNVSYSADKPVNPELKETLTDIIIEADCLLTEYYDDESFRVILDKGNYDMNDLLVLYKLTDRKDYADKEKVELLEDSYGDYRAQKKALIDNPERIVLQDRIILLDSQAKSISKSLKPFESYFEQQANVKAFEERFGNFNKQFSVSILKLHMMEKEGMAHDRDRGIIQSSDKFEAFNEEAVSNLETYFKAKGVHAEVDDLTNPADMPIGTIGGMLVCLFFPVIRNVLLKGYLKKQAYEGEYLLSGVAGIGNGMAGVFFLDGLHPLVLPARMLTPLVLQPIFKLTGFDPCERMIDRNK